MRALLNATRISCCPPPRSYQLLGHVWDACLGGRDFDYLLFEHFAAEIQRKYSYNVRDDPRSTLKLLQSCERLKKVACFSLLCKMSQWTVDERTTALWKTQVSFKAVNSTCTLHSCSAMTRHLCPTWGARVAHSISPHTPGVTEQQYRLAYPWHQQPSRAAAAGIVRSLCLVSWASSSAAPYAAGNRPTPRGDKIQCHVVYDCNIPPAFPVVSHRASAQSCARAPFNSLPIPFIDRRRNPIFHLPKCLLS